jgi:GNAT superfamily N-acetyltransferase
MIRLSDLLKESSKEDKISVVYSNEVVDAYDNQINFELGIFRKDGSGRGDGIIGLVEYVVFNRNITVSMIRVLSEYRRRGVGSRLIQKMKELNPEAKYKPSLKSELGAKFKHKRVSKEDMDWV